LFIRFRYTYPQPVLQKTGSAPRQISTGTDGQFSTGANNNGNFSAKEPRKRKLKQPRTPDEVLRAGIITVLKNMNGSGHIQQILAAMEQQLAGQLLEHDLENVASGKQLVWQNNVCWERNKMVKQGILKNDSLRGIWELTEAYR
jgi:hypothetical protein